MESLASPTSFRDALRCYLVSRRRTALAFSLLSRRIFSTSAPFTAPGYLFRLGFAMLDQIDVHSSRSSSPLTQNKLHPVISDLRFDAAFTRHHAKLQRQFALVAINDFRAAMSDDRARHSFFRAPTELGAYSGVSDQPVASLANKGVCESGAIADVKLHTFQRCDATVDEEKVRSIKNTSATCGHAVSDSRGENRMFNGERLEGDAANSDWGAIFDHMAIVDLVIR